MPPVHRGSVLSDLHQPPKIGVHQISVVGEQVIDQRCSLGVTRKGAKQVTGDPAPLGHPAVPGARLRERAYHAGRRRRRRRQSPCLRGRYWRPRVFNCRVFPSPADVPVADRLFGRSLAAVSGVLGVKVAVIDWQGAVDLRDANAPSPWLTFTSRVRTCVLGASPSAVSARGGWRETATRIAMPGSRSSPPRRTSHRDGSL
jgi:hypothetical protein